MRRGADAARVVELRALTLERLLPLGEERSPLVEKRLEGGQIDLGGIGLDLAKVGVYRRIEREVGTQTHTEVEPRSGAHPRALGKRIVGIELSVRHQARVAGEVRQQLDA